MQPLLTKFILNINKLLNQFEFDAHNRAKTFDQCYVQNVALTHGRRLEGKVSNQGPVLNRNQLKNMSTESTFYQRGIIGPNIHGWMWYHLHISIHLIQDSPMILS